MNGQEQPAPDPNDTRLPPATSAEWWELFNTAARDPQLTSTQHRLLSHLLSYANGPSTENGKRPLEDCRPGRIAMEEETGLSPATIKRTLRELRDLGYLHRIDRGGTRGSNASVYQLRAPTERVNAVKAAAEVRKESKRGITCEPPGGSQVSLLGDHPRAPTDSVPTQSPTQKTRPQRQAEASRAVMKKSADNDKVRAMARLSPEIVSAFQAVAKANATGNYSSDPDDWLHALVTKTHGEDFADFVRDKANITGLFTDEHQARRKLVILARTARTQGIDVLEHPDREPRLYTYTHPAA